MPEAPAPVTEQDVLFWKTLLKNAHASNEEDPPFTGDAEIKDITMESYKLLMAAPEALERVLFEREASAHREQLLLRALQQIHDSLNGTTYSRAVYAFDTAKLALERHHASLSGDVQER